MHANSREHYFCYKKKQNKTKQNDILNCVVDDPISTTYNKLGKKKNPRGFDNFKEQSAQETYSLNDFQSAYV